MRVLVIENYPNTPLGQVAKALDEAGAVREHVQPFAGGQVPTSSGGYDALVLLGGAQNALDDGNHPWFPATLDLVRDFEARDKAVLGICLGAQLLARTFGGENRIGGHYEFGWHRIALDTAAAKDPVFAGLPEAFSIFEWHDDNFTLPPGAVRLASSPVAEVQAFRVGRAVYGTQFHFEADRPQVDEWSGTFAELLAEREPEWPARRGDLGYRHGVEADTMGLALARAWVAAIRPSASPATS